MIAIIMPVIAAIGCVAVIIVLVISRSSLKREKLNTISTEKLNNLTNQLLNESSATRKEIQEIKEKVDSIEKIMKDI